MYNCLLISGCAHQACCNLADAEFLLSEFVVESRKALKKGLPADGNWQRLTIGYMTVGITDYKHVCLFLGRISYVTHVTQVLLYNHPLLQS